MGNKQKNYAPLYKLGQTLYFYDQENSLFKSFICFGIRLELNASTDADGKFIYYGEMCPVPIIKEENEVYGYPEAIVKDLHIQALERYHATCAEIGIDLKQMNLHRQALEKYKTTCEQIEENLELIRKELS